MSIVRQRIVDRITAEGPITFADFMETALYGEPDGYYISDARRPGRGGDFITSPELHPLFGNALANHVLDTWHRMGEPRPFTIREYGAAVGGLAYDILAGVLTTQPDLRPDLRYEMIEINAARRDQAMAAMAEVGLTDIVSAHATTPAPVTGIVIANEVADALPVHRLVVRSGTLRETRVGLADETFAWVESDLSEPVRHVPDYLARHRVDLPEGAVIEPSPAMAAWIAEVAAGLERGSVLIIDYGYPVTELLADHRLEGTIRGYYEHTVTDDPFERVGEQDLTAHVDESALIEAAGDAGLTLDGLTTQGDLMARIGLGDLLVAMQRDDIPFDVYLRAQGAVYRLIDPAGLGRFRALGLSKGVQGTSRAWIDPVHAITEPWTEAPRS